MPISFRRSPALGIALSVFLAMASAAAAQTLPGLKGPKTKPPPEAIAEQAPPVIPGQEVKVSASVSAPRVAPGGQLVVAVVMDHAKGWHSWPSIAQDVLPKEIAEFAIRTDIQLDAVPDWVDRIGPVQWPDPQTGHGANPMTGESMDLQLYQGRAVAFIPIIVKPGAPAGPKSLDVLVSYQACDATTCVAPEDRTVSVAMEISPDGAKAYAPTPGDFESFRAAVFADTSVWPGAKSTVPPGAEPEATGTPAHENPPATDTSGSIGSDFLGFNLGFLKGPLGVVVLLVLAAIGGAILNLTPCVLPVIPIKIMTLTRHSGTPGKSLYLGFWMALGVIAFWVAIGVPVALMNFGDPSRIFGYWYVTFGIGVLIAIMALGLMGLFTLTLPQRVYMINPNAETAPGSFLFGAMTAVLGLPCFGFVAGALLAAATKWGSATTLGVFAAIGIGMAAPYFILSAKPSLLKKVPKTGPASELVKQVMGLLLLAAGVYFIGSGLIGLVADKPWIAKQLHWWGVAVFASMAALWLIIRTAQITKRIGPTVVYAILGILIAGVAIVYARTSTNQARVTYLQHQSAEDSAELIPGTWTHFTPARFEAAQAKNAVVVLDFTAEWCLNCKALKAGVLDRDPTKSALSAGDVYLFEVDLTSRTDPGWAMLKSLGRTGIPTLAIYGPGLPANQPWISNAYTPDQVIAAVSQARGSAASEAAR